MTENNFLLFLTQEIDFDDTTNFFHIAPTCSLKQLEMYVKKVKNINMVDESGSSVLHILVHSSNYSSGWDGVYIKEKLEMLLRMGADYNITDSEMKTPLYYANAEVAQLFISHGAKYNSDKQESLADERLLKTEWKGSDEYKELMRLYKQNREPCEDEEEYSSSEDYSGGECSSSDYE
jgi:hypothetical protein